MMWDRHFANPPFAMKEIELAQALEPLDLGAEVRGAHVIVRHRGKPVDRLWFSRALDGAVIPVARLREALAGLGLDTAFATAFIDEVAPPPRPASPPSVTIAVCTRNRPDLLRRCLAALVAVRDAASAPPDLLVVDNAPPDSGTRDAVADFPGVRYAVEPVPGLNFGRNRALSEARGDWLGFIDDDAVVDSGWLDALHEGIAESPRAGGFSAPILPLMLETEAQLRFERAGGFGKGFHYRRFASEQWGDPLYPASQGELGTGASMVFSTRVLREIGGFDDALDTGPPLPGGGDTNMFYTVVRAGYPLVYLPGLMVHHEHRRDLRGLARQYGSWGRVNGALLEKTARTDPEMLRSHRTVLVLYFVSKTRRFLRALVGRGPLPPRFPFTEVTNIIPGALGEYRRSEKRVALRKKEFGA
jgi:GT2 family glycosyltransferase